MASRFRLQVVDRHTGKVAATWDPGSKAEREFVEEIVKATLARGVGIGRTAAHVEGDLRAAFQDVLMDLKADVRST